MTTSVEVEVVTRRPDVMGEGPAYDEARGRLIWVDIFGEQVCELTSSEASGWTMGRVWDVGAPVCAAIPREKGGLLLPTRSEFLVLSEDGEQSVFAALDEPHAAGMRFNDAKCDAQGRLVAGWIAEDVSRPASLVRLDPDGSIEKLAFEGRLPNGLDWSPDGETLYLVDTTTLGVEAFDYDATSGTISGGRTVVTVEPGVGLPDGMTVDRDGCLWIALMFAGEVRRFSPEGELIERVCTPTPMTTSCAFGGPSGTDLFITSASFKMPREVIADMGIGPDLIDAAERDEVGGALLVARPGASGPPAFAFAV